MSALELVNVTKDYGTGPEMVHALEATSLTVSLGEFVAIVGPSGCGKSTLLSVAGLLLEPTSGTVTINGSVVGSSEQQRTSIRASSVGYVFQSFNLFDHLDATQNVIEGLRFGPHTREQRDDYAASALDKVGLGNRSGHLPRQMSGGEQQRVAIARAIAKRPALLLADEPTGNLDGKTTSEIVDLLRDVADSSSLLLVTHDPSVAARADRVVDFAEAL